MSLNLPQTILANELPENLIGMFSKCLLILIPATLFSGCFFIPSKVPDQLETLRSQVTLGGTSRLEVHEQLGLPFISSEDRRIEVYRVASGSDVAVELLIIPKTYEVIIYSMIAYDGNGVVEAVDWHVYKDHDDDDLGGWVWRSARLQAGGFFFAAVKEGDFKQRKEILLAPVSETHNALHQPPPPDMCAVIFFFYEADYKREFFLDDEPIGEIPLLSSIYWHWSPYDLRVFTKVLVAEGKHEVRLTTSLKPREFRRKFICKPGRILYVYPQVKMVKSEPWGLWRREVKYEGEISVNSEPLESHEDWRRLLFYNGKWLGED